MKQKRVPPFGTFLHHDAYEANSHLAQSRLERQWNAKIMTGTPPDKPEKSTKSSGNKQVNANAIIASKLRSYYDGIIDEGTPDHLLSLLERLHEAEMKSKK
ncbi:NepR family anti-sigma factor [Rhizobium wuzhouense]|nr:NepR family anti-sigma factor [Rhizobium wuzhouense]